MFRNGTGSPKWTEEARNGPEPGTSRCKYVGPQSSYPRKTSLTYLKTCTGCTDKAAKECAEKRDARDANKENPSSEGTAGKRRGPTARAHEARPTLSWAEFSGLLEKHGKEVFELDAFVVLPAEEDDEAEIMADDGAETAKNIAKQVWDLTGHRFIYKKKKASAGSDTTHAFTFFCAQNNKEITKQKLTEDPKKRRAHETVGIRMTHFLTHCEYVDISMDEEIKNIVDEMKNSTPSAILTFKQIWDRILQENPSTEITRKQIIPIEKENGIVAIAFSFITILRDFGEEIAELAMDSTWKTNALGHELYGIVGEANGQAIPLGFMFIGHSEEETDSGAKERTLCHLIRHVKEHCANIMFTGSDKDTVEINGFRKEIPQAKHQLCYIHALSYIEKRLAEDRPSAAYDPRIAHRTFDFIDPTWAPGVSSGRVEDGVCEEDAEMEMVASDENQPSDWELVSGNIRYFSVSF
ncbi:hypothetical protein B0H11DRAFT_2348974 [Mycena galericulata]|nr:hypothetical protein B0H11DRAFT_2348974 [Mycena galericulata]